MNLWLLLALGLLTTLALGIGVINRIFPPSPPPPEKRGRREPRGHVKTTCHQLTGAEEP